jgi:hypothetical protein
MIESQEAAVIASGNRRMHIPRKYARVSSGGSLAAFSISASEARRSILPDLTRR